MTGDDLMAKNSEKTAMPRRGRGRPFKPGVSGNPGGRPSIPQDVKEAARAHTLKAIETLVAALDNPNGSVAIRAAEILLNRAWGSPPNSLELTGKDGGPVDLRNLSDQELDREIKALTADPAIRALLDGKLSA